MAQLPVAKVLEEFPFLDDRSAQEPFLYDVLCEVWQYQRDGYEKGTDGFATKDHLFTSRAIHMPFTPVREKNIEYVLELLTTRFSNNVSVIITFEFKFDEATKKLVLYEKEEYAINLTYEEHEALAVKRDEVSLVNFNQFVQRFRLFNLDKVIKKAKYRDDLSRVINKGLGTQFFAYKNYFIEKNRLEGSEEYCFHADNYEHVKRSLNLMQFKSIIETYHEMVKNRLRKFGILNTEISDYRDNKIDYLLSVLIDDLGTALVDKDRIDVKNFKSLRECILQVDKVLDPGQIRNDDIVKFIKTNKIATQQDIVSGIVQMTPDIFISWDTPERLFKAHIIKQNDHFRTPYYIDAHSLIQSLTMSYQSVANETNATPARQKEVNHTLAETLYRAAKQIVLYSTAETILGGNEQDVAKLNRLIEEYEALQKKMARQVEITKIAELPPKKKSLPLYIKILSFFSSLFSAFSHHEEIDETEYMSSANSSSDEYVEKMEPRRETKEIYEKATSRRGPVVALSDLIELTPDNEHLVTRIIQELRENNMRIVIPIYNARSVLYPKRSSKILISDVEYLLVPPNVIKSIDTISDYINSLFGYKLKEEVIPGRALVAIEKYLRILHKQRRASQMRKKAQVEKSLRK